MSAPGWIEWGSLWGFAVISGAHLGWGGCSWPHNMPGWPAPGPLGSRVPAGVFIPPGGQRRCPGSPTHGVQCSAPKAPTLTEVGSLPSHRHHPLPHLPSQGPAGLEMTLCWRPGCAQCWGLGFDIQAQGLSPNPTSSLPPSSMPLLEPVPVRGLVSTGPALLGTRGASPTPSGSRS